MKKPYSKTRLYDIARGPPRHVLEDGREVKQEPLRRRYPNIMKWLDRRVAVRTEFLPLVKRLPPAKMDRVLAMLDWAALEGAA